LLPGSLLLYPERVVYWVAPLVALTLALAWRALPETWTRRQDLRWTLVVLLLVMATGRHLHSYQRIAWQPETSRQDWEALCWAATHLDPRTDFVWAGYKSTGSYLPAVAGVACTGWHVHHFALPDWEARFKDRPVTYLFLEHDQPQPANISGEVVFRNSAVTIIRVRPPHQQASR
jgi:hypothetical protein